MIIALRYINTYFNSKLIMEICRDWTKSIMNSKVSRICCDASFVSLEKYCYVFEKRKKILCKIKFLKSKFSIWFYLLFQSLYEDHLFGDLIVTTTSNNNNISNNNSSSSSLLQTVADFGVVKPFSLLTKTLRYVNECVPQRKGRQRESMFCL